MKEYLFIGGSRNYEVYRVSQELDHVRLPTQEEMPYLCRMDAPDEPKLLRCETYVKRRMQTGDIFVLMGYIGMNDRDFRVVQLFFREKK